MGSERHAPTAGGSAKLAWPLLALAGLLAFNACADALAAGALDGAWRRGAFLHLSFAQGAPAGALVDVLNRGAPVIMLALGMALVIATRGVDLAVGSVMALSGAVAAQLVVAGHSAWIAIAVALLAALACGAWNGALVALLGIQPIVATLILMVAGRGLAQMVTDGQIVTFHDATLEFLGNGRPRFLPLPSPFLLAMLLFGATWLATRKTALGLFVEAAGGNPLAARYAGVPSRAIVVVTYVFSGLCAGCAGLAAAGSIKAADPTHAGLFLELDAIFAVVVGGTALSGGRFALGGAVVGALLIQTLTTTLYARDVSSDVAPLPKALVIVAVALLQSSELRARVLRRLGRRAA